MATVMGAKPGNPSSLHSFGRGARRLVENSRSQVAALCRARDDEIIFSSGATEANNMALYGLAACAKTNQRQILLSPTEHPSVLEPCKRLAAKGFELIWMKVGPDGIVDLVDAKAKLGPQVAFSSLMWINNETGTIQPIEEWANFCAENDVLLHSDAAQAVGRIAIDLDSLPLAALTMSAHKFHGPQGIGALYLRRGVPFSPTLVGGGQEREKRAGTECVFGLFGMAKALEFAVAELAQRREKVSALAKATLRGISAANIPFVLNARAAPRWPGVLNMQFEGQVAESLLMKLDLRGIAVSVGSACSSGSIEPSLVLSAMGLGVKENLSSIRVSFSAMNDSSDVDAFVEAMTEIHDLSR